MIPTESSIKAAKDSRETMRKAGTTSEDFISLSVTRRADEYQGPHPESRLQREEDELGEGDDGTPFSSVDPTLTKYVIIFQNLLNTPARRSALPLGRNQRNLKQRSEGRIWKNSLPTRKSKRPPCSFPVQCSSFSEEVDEETAEWENEQLRRTGVRPASTKPAKQVYKPAPSESIAQSYWSDYSRGA